MHTVNVLGLTLEVVSAACLAAALPETLAVRRVLFGLAVFSFLLVISFWLLVVAVVDVFFSFFVPPFFSLGIWVIVLAVMYMVAFLFGGLWEPKVTDEQRRGELTLWGSVFAMGFVLEWIAAVFS